MQYNSDNLHHMITDEPRESWVSLVKPLILKEDSSGVILNDNYHYGFTLESLKPDYRCKFNINDIIYYKDVQWIIMSYPLLDNRHSIDDIKSRCMSVIEFGSYIEILRPNSDGVDGKLYINDKFIYNLSYDGSVTENELSLVPENKITEEMKKFKGYIQHPDHKINLTW